MTEEASEPHPLDMDYDAPSESAPPVSATLFHNGLRKSGIVALLGGVAIAVLSMIVLSASRGTTSVEAVGSIAHRLGMVVMFIGFVLVFIAYRVPHLPHWMKHPESSAGKIGISSYSALVFWNIVAFLVAGLFTMVGAVGSVWISVLLVGCMPLMVSYAVTIAIWHRGFIRAYAIGALVSFLCYSQFLYQIVSYGNFGQSPAGWLLAMLAITQVSGLVCAGHARMLESRSEKEREQP